MAGASLGSQAAHAQLLRQITPAGLQPLPGSKVWGKDSTADVEMPLSYHARPKPGSLLVGLGHPNGFRFLVLFPGRGVYLPLQIADGFRGFDDYGDLRPGYFVEVATHRFSPQGEPELVIAVGDGRTELAVNVFKYHALASAKGVARPENWTVEGSFLGQAQARIKETAIEFPADAPKPSTTYLWTEGKFTAPHK